MDPADVKSYRPIGLSNLSVLSKSLQSDYRATCLQPAPQVPEGVMSDLQSAYRTHHSTETAIHPQSDVGHPDGTGRQKPRYADTA